MTKRLKLLADYQCFPLWIIEEHGTRNINPEELPLSEELKKSLREWALAYDRSLDKDYPPQSGFETEEKERWFYQEGERLLEELRRELGSDYLIVYQPWNR